MRDVMDRLAGWWADGHRVAVGTVIQTWSSAPRAPGAAMLVGPDGEAVGSVSGGCVEGAVYAVAERVLAGDPPSLEHYGVSDDEAFAVGLTCGGTIEVFVEAVDRDSFPALKAIADDVAERRPVAIATVVDGPGRLAEHLVIRPGSRDGSLGSERLDDAVTDDARGMLDQGMTGLRRYGPHGERRGDELGIFVQSFTPPPGCSSSGQSTLHRRWRASGPSSAITSRCATHGRCSPPEPGSRTRTRSSSGGHMNTSRRRRSTSAPSSVC